MQKKSITSFILIVLLLITLGGMAIASDLPIDIDAIGRQGEEQRYALTARWGIDLFTETADAQLEANAENQAREFEKIEALLFQEEQTLDRVNPIDTLRTAAEENDLLFLEPVQMRTVITVVEEDQGISLWITIPVIIVCAALGLFIAIRAKVKSAQREEQKDNVY